MSRSRAVSPLTRYSLSPFRWTRREMRTSGVASGSSAARLSKTSDTSA
jgi:hypothetical protein